MFSYERYLIDIINYKSLIIASSRMMISVALFIYNKR